MGGHSQSGQRSAIDGRDPQAGPGSTRASSPTKRDSVRQRPQPRGRGCPRPGPLSRRYLSCLPSDPDLVDPHLPARRGSSNFLLWQSPTYSEFGSWTPAVGPIRRGRVRGRVAAFRRARAPLRVPSRMTADPSGSDLATPLATGGVIAALGLSGVVLGGVWFQMLAVFGDPCDDLGAVRHSSFFPPIFFPIPHGSANGAGLLLPRRSLCLGAFGAVFHHRRIRAGGCALFMLIPLLGARWFLCRGAGGGCFSSTRGPRSWPAGGLRDLPRESTASSGFLVLFARDRWPTDIGRLLSPAVPIAGRRLSGPR